MTGDAGPLRIVCGRDDAGARDCDPATQVCCIGARGAESCTTAMACTGQALTCSGSESCGTGEHCCGTIGMGGGLRTRCSMTACPRGDVQLCTDNADCGGAMCRASGIGYGTCAPMVIRDAAAD
ncbi:MAG TPA: hypothetical protein VKU41_02190 [Polyangiaceae bacterium]|nr:hypothetical protein [Polyangiaceae bacterium]